MEKTVTCPLCGAGVATVGHITRRDHCPGCKEDLHSCNACRLHDPNAHNQCREPKTEWQPRRDRANYCDFFELADAQPNEAAATGPGENDRKQQLDDLFKNF